MGGGGGGGGDESSGDIERADVEVSESMLENDSEPDDDWDVGCEMNDDELTRSRLRFLSLPPKTSLPSESSRLRSRCGLLPSLAGTSSALAELMAGEAPWSRRKIEGKKEDDDVETVVDVAGTTVIMRVGAGDGDTAFLHHSKRDTRSIRGPHWGL
jgi:hypothetical protein